MENSAPISTIINNSKIIKEILPEGMSDLHFELINKISNLEDDILEINNDKGLKTFSVYQIYFNLENPFTDLTNFEDYLKEKNILSYLGERGDFKSSWIATGKSHKRNFEKGALTYYSNEDKTQQFFFSFKPTKGNSNYEIFAGFEYAPKD